ncbi:MAG: HAD family hydrolase [Deltaproteobacteria bacterium]|nr:HAD family hydrolase [Deltaproteobacteria bacterium]
MSDQRKAIFLDRDGVLIHDVHYLSKLEDIQIYPDVPKGLRRLQDFGYLLVVVTNQSGVARGYFPQKFVRECHDRINQLLEVHQVQLDHLYYCPHHVSGLPPYNLKCDCRKPAPAMIQQAEKELNLCLQASVMIGDKRSDVELAINADIKGILLTTGQGASTSQSVAQDYPSIPIFPSFTQAVDYIIEAADISLLQ